jgi:chromosome segregation ATPase
VSHASTEDIMRAVEALRRDVQSQGSDIRRLVEQHNDHERRIVEQEGLRPRMERLTEHVADIGSKVTVLVERAEAQERLMSSALRMVGSELARQVVDTVRAEMAGLRGHLGAIEARLDDRPCLAGPGCSIHGDKQ